MTLRLARLLAMAALMVVGLWLWPGAARGEASHRVVLLRPAATDEVTSYAVARVHGELNAAGFDVRTVPQDPNVDVRTALETSGRELDSIATFAITRGAPGSPRAAIAEIWVSNRVAGTSVIQSVQLSPDGSGAENERGAVILAVQAVELLKASLAQYWMEPVAPPPSIGGGAAAPPGATSTPAGPPFVTSGVAIQAGIGWLDSAGGVASIWQPIVRISYGVGAHSWAGRFTFGGFGTRAEMRATLGSARIEQQLGALEILKMFRAYRRLQILASAGAGLYHVHVSGGGVAPYVGRESDAWSALAIAGGGVAVRVVPHLAFLVEAQGILTVPHAIVRIGTEEVGTTGWPSAMISAGLLGTF